MDGGGSTKVTLNVDGTAESVDVDLARGVVVVRGATYPVTVVARSPLRLELEIAGEKVVVEGWPEGEATPPGPLDVNGERFRVAVEVAEAPGDARPPTTPTAPATASPAPPTSPGAGVAVLPPMPGRVVEVRVREGDVVAAGSVLLVLEAMKMRNEVAAPVAGRVRGLAVASGSSARAREPMLYLDPA